MKKSKAGRKPKPEAERKSQSYLLRINPVHNDFILKIADEQEVKPVEIIRQLIEDAYYSDHSANHIHRKSCVKNPTQSPQTTSPCARVMDVR